MIEEETYTNPEEQVSRFNALLLLLLLLLLLAVKTICMPYS